MTACPQLSFISTMMHRKDVDREGAGRCGTRAILQILGPPLSGLHLIGLPKIKLLDHIHLLKETQPPPVQSNTSIPL